MNTISKSSNQNKRNVPESNQENVRFLTGKGQFVADVVLTNPLYIAFYRSPVANARIVSCDTSEAADQSGVRAAFCGREVSQLGDLSVNSVLGEIDHLPFPVLANQNLLHVGQPAVAVLAETKQQAVDACEFISLEFEELTELTKTLPGQKNMTIPFSARWQQGNTENVFRNADQVVEVEIQHPRLAPSPMENRAISVEYNRENDHLTIWLSTQTPHRARTELSNILSVEIDRLRVIAPDVGGAFGLKASLYPEEVFAVWVAIKLRQSVKWTSTRSEDFLSASHGRGAKSKARLAFSNEGRFMAVDASIEASVGSWLTNSSAIPAWNAARILPGPYDIKTFDLKTKGVKSDTAPVGIYRGAGRPEAAMLMEQLVEKAASVLSREPMEIRKMNLLRSDQLPLKRNTGVELDSGDYRAALTRLLLSSDYKLLRRNQIARQKKCQLVGLGLSVFVEPCGIGWESASVCLNPDGSIVVKTGGSSQGHGRETAYAQIAADVFGCNTDRISVYWGDTETCPPGVGALASRSTAIGGSAVVKAARQVMNLAGGNLAPAEAIEESVIYECEAEAWGYGAYLAEVNIDPETGRLQIEKIHCIDDAGTIINPILVEGQIHGGVAQGIGEALMENVVYDDEGQLLSGSLMDYALPRATDIPSLTISHVQTPATGNLLGAKGVGEAGTIGAPAAIYNAAINALQPYGISSLPLPLTSNTIWSAIQSAKCNYGTNCNEI